MKIIGAGLAGLLCGALNPGSTIYERQSKLPNNHGAILRFRSDKISKALGIPFKKVLVTKDIYYTCGNSYWGNIGATPQIQNMYSYKVTGKYMSRSISDIKPVTRYIAPDNFIEQLAERCTIEYDFLWGKEWHADESTVSTIPMPVMMGLLNIETKLRFKRQKIWTRIHQIHGCDLYQTIYFPEANTPLYRASFTGNKLICEFIANPGISDWQVENIFHAFGLHHNPGYTEWGTDEQKYGKIIDIDHTVRRSIMYQLTQNHNIYSLGRFATWRNILLDDVYEDIFKIRDLMSRDNYSRKLKLSEEK